MHTSYISITLIYIYKIYLNPAATFMELCYPYLAAGNNLHSGVIDAFLTFQDFCISTIIQYALFSVWILIFSIMIWKFIQVVA